MKQYWLFALNSLVYMTFCMIATAFGNNISIDAVVVMGSLELLMAVGTQFLIIGGQAFKVFQQYEKSCCLLSVLVGIVLGVICITCGYAITFAFDITETQREMLRQALVCYGICCPAEALGRFLHRYITIKCYNKLILISNIVSNVLMLGTDWIAISLGWGCNGLVLSAGFSWLIYAVMLLIATKFFSQKDKVQWKHIKKALLVGKDLMLSGILVSGSNLCLGYFASTMGTEQYAIHTVALGAVNLGEVFRDVYCDYALVKLHNRTKYKEQKARRLFKQCWLPALLLPITGSFITTLIMHGKVNLLSALYGTALYCLPMLIYPVYDLLQQFALSRGRTKYMLGNCCICVIYRIFVPWILSKTIGINLITVSAIYLLDYLSRAVRYLFKLKHDKQMQIKLQKT